MARWPPGRAHDVVVQVVDFPLDMGIPLSARITLSAIDLLLGRLQWVVPQFEIGTAYVGVDSAE
jgi:hypothetical protein